MFIQNLLVSIKLLYLTFKKEYNALFLTSNILDQY